MKLTTDELVEEVRKILNKKEKTVGDVILDTILENFINKECTIADIARIKNNVIIVFNYDKQEETCKQ